MSEDLDSEYYLAQCNEKDMKLIRIEGERDAAISMLAEWCVDVADNGTGWDDWDENYKDAMYRPCALREQLDEAIANVRKQRYGGRG